MPAPYTLSYWERASFFPDFQVAVLGSGLVGLNAAIRLKEIDPQLRVVVIERGPVPLGASTRNAGFACFGSITELLADLEHQSEDAVWSLVEKRWRGLEKLRSLLGDQSIEFNPSGGYELFRAEDQERFEQCRDHIPAFNRSLQAITGIKENFRSVPEKISSFGFQQTAQLVESKAEGLIHTGQMMRALLERARTAGVEIYFGLPIERIEESSQGVSLISEHGWSIQAEQLLVATNGFAHRFFPELDLRAVRNQVLITRPLPQMRLRGCYHYDAGYYYFRHVENRVLLGGGRNLDLAGETTDQFGQTPRIQQALLEMLEQVVLPGQKFEVDQWWSGILGVGAHKRPIIKKCGERTVVAVRLGGMGVAIGSLVGMEAADLLMKA